MQKTLKGTLSATFGGLIDDFKLLAMASLVPALLLMCLTLSSKLITIRQYESYLAGNQLAFSSGGLAWLNAIIPPVVSVYVFALWFTVLATQLWREEGPALLPSGSDFKNALFVVLYGMAFLILPYLLIFGLTQFGFYLAGKPLLSGGTVTIPWQESAPMLAAMAIVLPLIFWLFAVCDANLPRIARGYRPNLFWEVLSFSKGVQTALTIRTLALSFLIFLLFTLFVFIVLLPTMSLVTSAFPPVTQTDTKTLLELQIKMQWLNIYFEPLFTILLTPVMWLFCLFWHEVDMRLTTQ